MSIVSREEKAWDIKEYERILLLFFSDWKRALKASDKATQWVTDRLPESLKKLYMLT